MTCADVADLVEPIASGDLAADAGVTAHLAACPSCAQSLQAAQRVERLLLERPAPAAPAQFTSRLVHRLQRASWRREQIVDGVFNGAMVAAAMLVAAGLWIALRRTGVPLAGRDAMELFSAGMNAAAQKLTPALPLYAAATGLLVAALGLWWWASDSSAL